MMAESVWLRTVFVIGVLVASQACNKKSSSTLSAQTGPARPPQEINLPCAPGVSAIGPVPVELKGNGTRYRLNADWCFNSVKAGRVRLLFIADTSGSMQSSDPSCARYQAIESEIRRHAAPPKQPGSVVVPTGGPNIEVAVVTFGSDAQIVRGFGPAEAALGDPALRDAICTPFGETNYSAAFQKAHEALGSLPPSSNNIPVVTYFLTDGMPTDALSTSSPRDAAAPLRGALAQRGDGSAMFAVYLDAMNAVGLGGGPSALPPLPPSSASMPGGPVPIAASTLGAGRDPMQILTDVTGSRDLVRTIVDINQLPAALAELAKPAAPIDPKSVQYTVTSNTRPMVLPCRGDDECRVILDPADSGKWRVSLEYYPSNSSLVSDTGIVIDGRRLDGSSVRAEIAFIRAPVAPR